MATRTQNRIKKLLDAADTRDWQYRTSDREWRPLRSHPRFLEPGEEITIRHPLNRHLKAEYGGLAGFKNLFGFGVVDLQVEGEWFSSSYFTSRYVDPGLPDGMKRRDTYKGFEAVASMALEWIVRLDSDGNLDGVANFDGYYENKSTLKALERQVSVDSPGLVPWTVGAAAVAVRRADALRRYNAERDKARRIAETLREQRAAVEVERDSLGELNRALRAANEVQ